MSEKTIQCFGHRSDFVVMGIAIFFAIVGSVLVIAFGGSAIWGVWLPFCFIAIPAVHYLCREVLSLRHRIEELEKKLK